MLKEREAELSASFNDSSAALETSVSALLSGAGDQSTSSPGLAVSTYDQGRLLLTLISVVSVIAATLAAWLWAGNGMVRRNRPRGYQNSCGRPWKVGGKTKPAYHSSRNRLMSAKNWRSA